MLLRRIGRRDGINNENNRILFNFKDKRNINITNISNIIVNENEAKKIMTKNENKVNYIKKIVLSNKKMKKFFHEIERT